MTDVGAHAARGRKRPLTKRRRRLSCTLINTSTLPTHAHAGSRTTDCMKNCKPLQISSLIILYPYDPVKYILMHY